MLRDPRLDPRWTARLRAFKAILGPPDNRLATARRAIDDGERSGDPTSLGWALHALAIAERSTDETVALATLERAIAVVGDGWETAELRGMFLGNRMASLCNVGRLAEIPQAIEEALRAAELDGMQSQQLAVRLQIAELYYFWGRWDDARTELAAAAELLGADRQRMFWWHTRRPRHAPVRGTCSRHRPAPGERERRPAARRPGHRGRGRRPPGRRAGRPSGRLYRARLQPTVTRPRR